MLMRSSYAFVSHPNVPATSVQVNCVSEADDQIARPKSANCRQQHEQVIVFEHDIPKSAAAKESTCYLRLEVIGKEYV